MRKILALAFVLVFVASPALAFHDEGVAHCNGCHTMHNSQDGALVDEESAEGNDFLLNDATPSDTCLGCHAGGGGSYHVLAPDPLVPTNERGAGDFVFLTEDNINDGHAGGDHPISGEKAGHNIKAPGYGISADATLTTAPGGIFPSNNLGCSSCHDPHGNSNFRLLYGVGAVAGGAFTFTAAAPDAEGLNVFAGGVEANDNHTAYKGGMSAWCGNCHGDFHSGGGVLRHPSGQGMGSSVAAVYNRYNGTSAQNGAVEASSYLAAVPFEDPANTLSSTAGPSGTSQVSCITCHRAHATSAPDAGRWDFSVTFLHEDGLESGSYPIPDPYEDMNQRSLCNKCHNKDAGDVNPY